jgi:hypothetical protein
MKNFLFALLATVCTFASFNADAQVYSMAHNGDTVTNTETEYLTLTVKNSYDVVTFQYVCNKLSGTVAGTATLQASLDGTNFIDLDTLTNTNVSTQTFFFDTDVSSPNKYLYYRVKCTGVGTMAARVYVYVLPRQ